MFNTLIVKWILAVFLAAVTAIGVYYVYAHVKQIGYNEAVALYEKRDRENADRMEQHIHTLEVLSTTIVANNDSYMNKFDKDIKSILYTVKGLTPYVIVDGKCLPSPAFNDAYNKLIGKANE